MPDPTSDPVHKVYATSLKLVDKGLSGSGSLFDVIKKYVFWDDHEPDRLLASLKKLLDKEGDGAGIKRVSVYAFDFLKPGARPIECLQEHVWKSRSATEDTQGADKLRELWDNDEVRGAPSFKLSDAPSFKLIASFKKDKKKQDPTFYCTDALKNTFQPFVNDTPLNVTVSTETNDVVKTLLNLYGTNIGVLYIPAYSIATMADHGGAGHEPGLVPLLSAMLWVESTADKDKFRGVVAKLFPALVRASDFLCGVYYTAQLHADSLKEAENVAATKATAKLHESISTDLGRLVEHVQSAWEHAIAIDWRMNISGKSVFNFCDNISQLFDSKADYLEYDSNATTVGDLRLCKPKNDQSNGAKRIAISHSIESPHRSYSSNGNPAINNWNAYAGFLHCLGIVTGAAIFKGEGLTVSDERTAKLLFHVLKILFQRPLADAYMLNPLQILVACHVALEGEKTSVSINNAMQSNAVYTLHQNSKSLRDISQFVSQFTRGTTGVKWWDSNTLTGAAELSPQGPRCLEILSALIQLLKTELWKHGHSDYAQLTRVCLDDTESDFIWVFIELDGHLGEEVFKVSRTDRMRGLRGCLRLIAEVVGLDGPPSRLCMADYDQTILKKIIYRTSHGALAVGERKDNSVIAWAVKRKVLDPLPSET